MLRLYIDSQHISVAYNRMDEPLVNPLFPQDLLFFDAVLLRILLKIKIMKNAHGLPKILIIIPIVVCALAVYVLLSRRVTHPVLRWSFVLVLGGAIGNLIDRVFRGFVVDMFEITLFRFAIFNVADIFVTAGAVLLVIYILFFMRDVTGDPNAG